MAEVVEFPQTIEPLTCDDCGGNAWYILGGGDNPYNIGAFVCVECDSQYELLPVEYLEISGDDGEPRLHTT